MKRSELVFTTLLVPLDAIMLFAAFVVAYYLRDNISLLSPDLAVLSDKFQYTPGVGLQPFTSYLHYVWYLVPSMVLIFAFTGLYRIRSSANFWRRFARITVGVSAGLFFILLLFLFKKDFFIPRTTVLYAWLFGIIFVAIGRWFIRLLQQTLYPRGIGAIRIGVVGSGRAADELIERLSSDANPQYKVVERFSDDCTSILSNITRDTLDELIVASDTLGSDELIELRNRCLEMHVGFSFLPKTISVIEGATFAVRVELGQPIIEVRPTPLDGWGRVYKRLFDISMSIVLLILLSPIYLLICIAMLSTSKGTAITFKNKRIGRAGRDIFVTKFRTMKPGWSDENGTLSRKFQHYLDTNPEAMKEWQETAKLKNDPRISSLGAFLRATRLDELPQFFDVLRGDLSLVGPRPILPWELEKFGDRARILFHVRPGITGPWQVEGGNSLPYEERVRLNTYYIEHWTLLMDLGILVKTAWLVLMGVLGKLFGFKTSNEAY